MVLNDVSVAFQTSNGIDFALKNINLSINEGDFAVIIGKNGSGKSTLLRVLSGLCPLSKGTITYAKENCAVQVVLQNPESQIVGETVYEDICFGLENMGVQREDMLHKVIDALKWVGLEDAIYQPVEHLSGGQKQLLSIAGALALDAQVILFDEATSMLDPLSRENVLEVVLQLNKKGKTVIWATQFMEEVGYGNRVFALDSSRLVFQGHPREFFYGQQQNSREHPCLSLGFKPPYAVEMAYHLIESGIHLSELPLTIQQMKRVITDLCRS